MQSKVKRVVIKTTLAFLFVFAMAIVLKFTDIQKKVTDEIIGNAFGISRSQMVAQTENESKYDLGISVDDILANNVIPFILPAVNVAFFRPYITEVKKPLLIFSFLESAMFMLLVIYVLLKGYVFKTIKIIINEPLLIFCILYSIFFAFFVGIVSANFGTLIRYKAPFVPYLLMALLIIVDKLKHKPSITNDTIS